jgi:sugar phosphate isomerase/epimerase
MGEAAQPLRDRLGLHHLTVLDASPAGLVGIAAEIGCPHVTLFVQATGRSNDAYPILTEGAQALEVRQLLRETGVKVHNLEAFVLRPSMPAEAYEPALDLGASLGAGRLTVLVGDPDLGRAFDRFCGVCEKAAARGLAVHVEFHAFTQVRTFGAAQGFLARGRPANAGLAVDALHLHRNDHGIEPLRFKGGAPVAYAQICDGPQTVSPDEAFAEAVGNRMLPGEGSFDLPGFVALLPRDIVLDIEVPSRVLQERGLGPLERARLVMDATLRCLGD